MLFKTKLALLLIPVLILGLTVSSVSAVKDISEVGFYNTCKVHEANDKDTVMDYLCWLDLVQMWKDINTLLDSVSIIVSNLDSINATMNEQFSSLDEKIGKTTTKANKALDRLDNHNRRIMVANSERADFESRLQVLEGVIPPPDDEHPLVVTLIPDSIVQGEKFTVYGHVNRIEQFWVDFTVYDPNENPVQWFSINSLQNGGFYPPAISPKNWNVNGTYTIFAEHGPHNATNTIQYTLDQNP